MIRHSCKLSYTLFRDTDDEYGIMIFFDVNTNGSSKKEWEQSVVNAFSSFQSSYEKGELEINYLGDAVESRELVSELITGINDESWNLIDSVQVLDEREVA